ncbi:hypothetical protein GCM10009411_12970 [Shewanella litoralis]|uniref:Uncharacterized protein n=1 Tax=Shewanella litoralis TaxID=2282700 RepID=A0ABQ2R4T2_9GAMM|nr:hypothetical protein GCM10009411_12970 [Shewanella litoralis]
MVKFILPIDQQILLVKINVIKILTVNIFIQLFNLQTKVEQPGYVLSLPYGKAKFKFKNSYLAKQENKLNLNDRLNITFT